MAMNGVGGLGSNWKQNKAKAIVKKIDNLASHAARKSEGKSDLDPAADKVKLESARPLDDIANTESIMQTLKSKSKVASPEMKELGAVATKMSKNLAVAFGGAIAAAALVGFATPSPFPMAGSSSEIEGTVGKDGQITSLDAKQDSYVMMSSGSKEELSMRTLEDGRKQYTVSTSSFSLAGSSQRDEVVTVSEGKGGVLTYDYDTSFSSNNFVDKLRSSRQAAKAEPRKSEDS